MEYLPFQNFIDAAPELDFSCNEKGEVTEKYKFTNSIETILGSLDSKKELTLLEYKLNELDKDKQFGYVEIFLSKLIHSSYIIRREIGNIEENKNLKIKLINEIESCIVCILSLLKQKNINIPISFSEKYKNSNKIGIVIKKMFDFQNKNTQQLNINEPFTTQISQTQREYLFKELKDNKFISSNTDKDSFMYVFGSSTYPKKFIHIEWLENKQYLYELTTSIDSTNKSKTKRKIKLFFTKENKECNMDKYKNKAILSHRSDIITKILATLSNY